MLAFRGRDRRGRKDPLDRGWAAIDLLFKKRSYGGSMVQWGVAQRRNVASCILSPFPVLCKVAHMGRIGLPELLIVLAILVLIFGANRLPELGRGIGRGIRNFKEANKDGSEKT